VPKAWVVGVNVRASRSVPGLICRPTPRAKRRGPPCAGAERRNRRSTAAGLLKPAAAMVGSDWLSCGASWRAWNRARRHLWRGGDSRHGLQRSELM
jgi:hypothetical protein